MEAYPGTLNTGRISGSISAPISSRRPKSVTKTTKRPAIIMVTITVLLTARPSPPTAASRMGAGPTWNTTIEAKIRPRIYRTME